MSLDPANLKMYLSGGAANADPAASLGGARSSVALPTGLFDAVTGDEAAAGDVEYRCVYFRNEDADATGLIAPFLWITSNTPSADSTIAIGLDPAGKNGTATTVVDESTAPAGVTFSAPSSKATGLALPSAPYGQNAFVAIWVRRTINAGAAAAASDPASFRVEGDAP